MSIQLAPHDPPITNSQSLVLGHQLPRQLIVQDLIPPTYFMQLAKPDPVVGPVVGLTRLSAIRRTGKAPRNSIARCLRSYASTDCLTAAWSQVQSSTCFVQLATPDTTGAHHDRNRAMRDVTRAWFLSWHSQTTKHFQPRRFSLRTLRLSRSTFLASFGNQ